MEVCLYLSAAINGYISEAGNNRMISSQQGWDRYIGTVKSFRNVVIGRKTFEAMRKYGRLAEFGSAKIIVLSRNAMDGAFIVAKSPEEAISIAKGLGFSRILLNGGSETVLSFLSEKLIDDIYVEIEPLAFADGKRMLNEGILVRLELLDMDSYEDGAVRLHYRVKG